MIKYWKINSYQILDKLYKVVVEARKSTHLEFDYQITSIFVFVNLRKYIIYDSESPIRNTANES